jgi:hypothetical protein
MIWKYNCTMTSLINLIHQQQFDQTKMGDQILEKTKIED